MGNGFGSPNLPRGTQIQVAVVGSKGVGKTTLMEYIQKKIYPKKEVRVLEGNKTRWSFVMDLNETVSLRLTEEPDSDSPTTFIFETAEVCVMCFSVVDERTYQAVLEKWVPAAASNPALPIILLGTQTDLRSDGKKKGKAPAAPKITIHEELKKASDHPRNCLSQMPSDVLLEVFSHLPLPDLYAAMRVSKRWNKLANGRYIWKNRVRRRGKPITPDRGKSMAEKICAEKYLECSALMGQGVKAVVDEVLKFGIQAYQDNNGLGGAVRRKRKEAERAKQEKKEEGKGKERDDKKQNGGTASATSTDTKGGDDKAKSLADPSARPASAANGASGAAASAGKEEEKKDAAGEAAKPAAAGAASGK